ncbi:hypothetical protein BO85DRAFT_464590 [Aspergillus piperis CBS 112811]|uniref:Uncharacterized protein n=1 Tax=Aspergillus piperis CBS 112811 TaxID=1448313 RepID=A0A8G1QSV4_9EURO|nr:hypothetical protein BO85DRAFT_464590 [Aspergillus piperis CBS 112811]RAH51645.1 hypothetical protein BO85DRAFT_464590 [Aspergillus piperis CBS 112811]
MRKCQSGRAPHPNFLWASGCGAAADVRAFAGFYLTMEEHYYSCLHGAQLAFDTDPPLETKKTLSGSRCHSFLHTGSPRVKAGGTRLFLPKAQIRHESVTESPSSGQQPECRSITSTTTTANRDTPSTLPDYSNTSGSQTTKSSSPSLPPSPLLSGASCLHPTVPGGFFFFVGVYSD